MKEIFFNRGVRLSKDDSIRIYIHGLRFDSGNVLSTTIYDSYYIIIQCIHSFLHFQLQME